MSATKQNQSVPRLLSNQSNGNRLPLWKLEMKVEVGGLELWYCARYYCSFSVSSWRTSLELNWITQTAAQRLLYRPTCKPIRERKFVFVFFAFKNESLCNAKKCRLTVGLSRISSISKDERAANFKFDIRTGRPKVSLRHCVSILTRDTDIANPSVRPLRSGIVWKRLNVLS